MSPQSLNTASLRAYLAHHELESGVVININIITIMIIIVVTGAPCVGCCGLTQKPCSEVRGPERSGLTQTEQRAE